jgi:hypothetical protein
MTKPKDPKTYFEKVPLEIVKQIAEEDPSDDAASGADAPVEPPAKKRSAFPRRKPTPVSDL